MDFKVMLRDAYGWVMACTPEKLGWVKAQAVPRQINYVNRFDVTLSFVYSHQMDLGEDRVLVYDEVVMPEFTGKGSLHSVIVVTFQTMILPKYRSSNL